MFDLITNYVFHYFSVSSTFGDIFSFFFTIEIYVKANSQQTDFFRYLHENTCA